MISKRFSAPQRAPQAIEVVARSLAVLLLACLPAAGVSVPDWVRQAAAQSLPKYPPDTKAVVLLDDEQDVVSGPGDYVERHRRVVKILRPDGRSEGQLRIYLDGEREKLVSIHAWTIDRSGHEYELKDKDFLDGSSYSFELYSDFRFRYADAPAAQPGSIIALEHEVRRHDWFNLLRWVFQEDNPVRTASFTAELPAGWEMKPSWAGASPVEPVSSGDRRWTWTVRDVPAIEDEPMMPSGTALSGRMVVAYLAPGQPHVGSWRDVGLSYLSMIKGRRDPSPEIADRVHQLIAGHTDFDSKLRILSSFIQSEIRYVAIEIGIGGHQPHAAPQVFRARYGDCKDKATLLSSMLREAGIESDYVLIDTRRGVVHPDLPAPWFNHAILAIELPRDSTLSLYPSNVQAADGKRYIIFDPTDEYTPVGQLRGRLQSSYALLVTDAGGELIKTPLLAPEVSTLARVGHFVLDAAGVLSGNVTETRSGDYATYERRYLIQANQAERTQRIERRLNGSLQGFTLASLDIQQLKERDQRLALSYRFVTPNYGQIRGPLMLVRPRVLGEISIAVDRKPRQYPVEFDGPSRQTDNFEIEIPTGFAVDDVPEPTSIDTGFARYQSRFETSGNKVRYSREYIVRDVRITPDRIEEFRNLQGKIGADEFSAVVLKRSMP